MLCSVVVLPEPHAPGEAGAGGPSSSPRAAAMAGYGKEDVESHRWSCKEKEGQSQPGRELSTPRHGEAGGQEEVLELALCSQSNEGNN